MKIDNVAQLTRICTLNLNALINHCFRKIDSEPCSVRNKYFYGAKLFTRY